MAMSKRLYRSQQKVLGGVCAGIAEYLGLDPTLVRIAYVIISLISVAFPGVLIYIILWIIMPEQY